MPKQITVKRLRDNGWVVNDLKKNPELIPIFAEKKIENRNPLNASEDSDIKLIIHGLFNVNTFSVLLPDGGMLNFVANSMEELQAFEKAIIFYDPPF